ncbi:MAG: hypothetical protein M9962_09190 [Oligoflexia bacterium]|nr:hypothetical protein [Oligoflexia bacterium]
MFLSLLLFSASSFAVDFSNSPKFFETKATIRKKIIKNAEPSLLTAKPTYYDLAKNLVDDRDMEGNPVRFLSNMQELAAFSIGTSKKDIWASSYWPMYKGGVAYRYRDRLFTPSKDWMVNYSHFLSTVTLPSDLSATEKLEKVFGDFSRKVSFHQWSQGKWYYDQYRIVEDWMGICHGWSQAAHMLARPKKTVPISYVNSFGQIETMEFYPSDIKALASQIWADFDYSTRFVGSRCDVENLVRDENGRVRDPNHPECEDTNPATFHLSLVNQIGLMGRSFTLDSVNSSEVWNYPIKNYQISYFDVQTEQTSDDWKSLLVRKEIYNNDPYQKYRSNDVAYILGAKASVRVLSDEEEPSTDKVDGVEQDVYLDFSFSYDLELDENFEVIGGEWRSENFPDFLWVATRNAKIYSYGSDYIREPWDGAAPVPVSWKSAYEIDAEEGMILSNFVDLLVRKSQ